MLLLAGVIARYVLNTPLVWSDELASILFLWLGMLGAVVALHRAEHMRMTTLVNRTSPRVHGFFDALRLVAAVAFLAVMVMPSFDYAINQAAITTPALQISDLWRAAALPVGTVLMMVLALLRLPRAAGPFHVIGAIALVGAVLFGLWLTQDWFTALGNLNLILFFVVGVAAMVLAGVPIAFAFGLATFLYLAVTTDMPLTVVMSRLNDGMSQLILLAVPMFVFLGLLIEMTGMARAMVDFLANLVGHLRGGLSYVLLGGIFLISGISGSKAADMAAIAPVLFPEMQRRGAKGGELIAQLSASGAMSETIPPSLVLITLGSVTGVSIAALFTGGVLPAVVAGGALCIVVWFRSHHDDLSHVRRANAREIVRSCAIALPALILPFVIRFAVVEGIATATEVSTIGIAYCFIIGPLLYRQFDLRRLLPMLVETASLSGAILLIIGAATSMAWALTQSGFSHQLAVMMRSLPGGGASFLAISILVFVVLGSVLEGIPAIVLFGPLLFPIAREVGVNEVHYAMVAILAMGIGLFAPPFGVGYYAACAVGRVNPDEGIGPIWGYLFALLLALILVAAVPWISTGFL